MGKSNKNKNKKNSNYKKPTAPNTVNKSNGNSSSTNKTVTNKPVQNNVATNKIPSSKPIANKSIPNTANKQTPTKATSNSNNKLVFDTPKPTSTKANKNITQSGTLQFDSKPQTKNEVPKIQSTTKPAKPIKIPEPIKKPQSNILQFEKLKPMKTKKEAPPKEKMSTKQKIAYGMKVAFFTLMGLFLSGSIIIGIIIGNWLSDLPELDTTLLTEVSQSSLIYDKDGNLLASYSSYENREWANLEEIPEDLKNAVLSIEDHDFYNHNGIYVKRLAGAILGQLTGNDDYGGSTITQQLIKNVYLTHEVTYKRKAQELVLALDLEKKMEKDDILEAYLNIIYLGGSNYGVKSAAKDYFGKDLSELTTRECALIAGLAKNPNGYSPRRNQEKGDMTPTNKRTDDVLWTMHQRGKLTDEEYEAAINDTIIVAEGSSYSEKYPYAHYIEYVLDEVATDLLIKEGKTVNSTNIMYKKYAIRNGGYKIYTTLDPKAQETLQEAASTFDGYPEAEDGNGVEVSAVIMDQHTGQIVAMIGSKNEPTALETFNRAVDSTQPIGSTMKPIAIFAPAIENGLAPSTLTGDYKSAIKGYDTKDGFPGGVSWNSPMTMRQAIETSHNIPAARFLVEHVGYSSASDYLVRMGVNSNNISATGSGLALGTSDVTTLEITGAYATLANDGKFIEPHAYTKVLNRKNEEVLSDKDKAERRVFSESTAWLMTDMLTSQVTNGSGGYAKIKGITTAGKTGTHEDKCITFAGYTGYYTSVVRISSDSYSSMKNASGTVQAAKLWKAYMQPLHEELEDKQIQSKSDKDLNLIKVQTCSISGDLASSLCKEAGHTLYDYFLDGTQPTKKCTAHIRICTVTGLLAVDGCEETQPTAIATYISPQSYLYKIDHSLLMSSISELRLAKITDPCDQEHLKPEEPEPTEPTEDPNADPDDNNDDNNHRPHNPTPPSPPSPPQDQEDSESSEENNNDSNSSESESSEVSENSESSENDEEDNENNAG